MKRTLLIVCVALAGCSAANSGGQLAKCEIEWRASSDRVKDEWGRSEDYYFRDCMRAADFEFNYESEVCLKDSGQPTCYSDRKSFSYRLKHLFK